MAIEDAGLDLLSDEDKLNIGVSIGSGIGGLETIYNGFASSNTAYNFNWDASILSSGLYIIKVDAPEFKYSKVVEYPIEARAFLAVEYLNSGLSPKVNKASLQPVFSACLAKSIIS